MKGEKSEGNLALRNLEFRNKVTDEVLVVTVEGHEFPVNLLVKRIVDLVLSSLKWEQVVEG